jgi:hypothetical protein
MSDPAQKRRQLLAVTGGFIAAVKLFVLHVEVVRERRPLNMAIDLLDIAMGVGVVAWAFLPGLRRWRPAIAISWAAVACRVALTVPLAIGLFK